MLDMTDGNSLFYVLIKRTSYTSLDTVISSRKCKVGTSVCHLATIKYYFNKSSLHYIGRKKNRNSHHYFVLVIFFRVNERFHK